MVRAAEAARVPGNEGFALAVARYLYKLMAYKDEYEVPRLSLDESIDMQVHKVFGARARVSYQLRYLLLGRQVQGQRLQRTRQPLPRPRPGRVRGRGRQDRLVPRGALPPYRQTPRQETGHRRRRSLDPRDRVAPAVRRTGRIHRSRR